MFVGGKNGICPCSWPHVAPWHHFFALQNVLQRKKVLPRRDVGPRTRTSDKWSVRSPGVTSFLISNNRSFAPWPESCHRSHTAAHDTRFRNGVLLEVAHNACLTPACGACERLYEAEHNRNPGLAEYGSPWATLDAAPRLGAGPSIRDRGGSSIHLQRRKRTPALLQAQQITNDKS